MKRDQMRLAMTWAKRSFCGAVMMAASCSRVSFGIFGELGGGFVAELGERPLRRHFGADFERDVDERLAASHFEAVQGSRCW
jgi:hypothetical protein